MYMLMGYSEAVVVETVVLDASANFMRVAAVGFEDTIELTRIGNQWFGEEGERVEIQFICSLEPETRNTVPAHHVKARAAS
ncbi:MAG TPA: hypothetical protein VGH38_34465 [Bryobacteraceae bacterium]|jgi:hypothetical protein